MIHVARLLMLLKRLLERAEQSVERRSDVVTASSCRNDFSLGDATAGSRHYDGLSHFASTFVAPAEPFIIGKTEQSVGVGLT